MAKGKSKAHKLAKTAEISEPGLEKTEDKEPENVEETEELPPDSQEPEPKLEEEEEPKEEQQTEQTEQTEQTVPEAGDVSSEPPKDEDETSKEEKIETVEDTQEVVELVETVEEPPVKNAEQTKGKKKKEKPKSKKKKAKGKKPKKGELTMEAEEENADDQKVDKAKKTETRKKHKLKKHQIEAPVEEGDGDKVRKSTSKSQPSVEKIAAKKKKTKSKRTTAKKKKDKKLKKTTSASQHSLESLTARKRSKEKARKTPSASRTILQTASSRMSRGSGMMGRTKSKSVGLITKQTSDWTFVDDDASIDSEYSYEELGDEKEVRSSVLFRTGSRTKKRKKGKKGKKEKKEKSSDRSVGKKKRKAAKKKKGERKDEEEEPAIEPQDDVMAEIARMKYLAELETREDGSEEAPTTEPESKKKKKKKKKKKGGKKKLSKKEKAKLAAEQAEKAKMSAEEEAKKAAELERIRLEEERKAAIEKEKRETFEQQIRMEQLEAAFGHFDDLVAYNKNLRADAKALAEWEFYVNCGRLPNPGKCEQMNTFLHLWQNVVDTTTMDDAAARTVDMLELLDELDDLIDTAENKNEELVKNWKWVRLLFREQQAKSLDVATYRLLRNIEKNLNRIDIPTADYNYKDDNIALCLWLRIQLPTPLPNPRRPPKPRIEVNFPEIKLEVQFPWTIDGDKTAVRALYVKYDHLSDISDSYQKPEIPQQYDIDLYQAMKSEWYEKMLYKYENRVRKTPIIVPPPDEEQEDVPSSDTPQEEVLQQEDEIPVVPYRKLDPTASDYVIAKENTLYENTRRELIKTVDEDVINLRKYTIIGGVYSLNLLEQPPQPQDFVTLEMNLTPLYLPKELRMVDVNLTYTPPAPPPTGVRRLPEEIEEEMKKQEEAMDNLILITLTWPEHVIFLELPIVCFWDETRSVWTRSEVYDLKHNEEKGQLSFRSRKGGTFALAAYRYANLPYQAWEIRPEADGTVTLQITAAILLVEFNVKQGLVALSQLQNSTNNALQDIIGAYHPLPKLIRMLQNAGVDVFPAFDAFCYIENTCEKHWPTEKHLYFNMAEMGACFNFAWSRWNLAQNRRSIVLQTREYNVEKTKQKNHLMLHVTPLYAVFVDCTEVSQTFSEEGIENMKFYPDLQHLMKGTSGMAVKKKVANVSRELVFAVYELLIATRVVSFS